MVALRGVLAVCAGTLLALVAGVLFDLLNARLGWIEPKYGYMYFYPWLTTLGGLLAGALTAICFAAWNRAPAGRISPGQVVLGIGAGTLTALIAGALFDYANGYFGWVTPALAYQYVYTWLAALGGLLSGAAAVLNMPGRPQAAPATAGGRGKAPKAAHPVKADKSFTSARAKQGGFADVPGMPLGDFESALTPGNTDKEQG